jgi:hypothetical protein
MAEPANIVDPPAKEAPPPAVHGPSVELGNRFHIYPNMPVPDMSTASVRAFSAIDTRDDGVPRVALICSNDLLPRLEMAKALKTVDRPGLLRLYDFDLVNWPGTKGKRPALIYDFPEGGPLWSGKAPRDNWPAAKIVSHILNPLAVGLGEMFLRSVTHRALRPQNLFWLDKARTRVVMGPCLQVPPGYDQPAAFEPLAGAMADPEARGNGTRADDMFAFGMTLLAFAQGSLPGADLDPDEAIYRRIDANSFDALADLNKLPATLMEVMRGLTNDWEPDRWTIEHLRGWIEGKRQQIPSTAPQMSRASQGYKFAKREHKNTRTLAHAMGKNFEQAAKELRNGAIPMWLRSSLGDQKLHDRVMSVVNEPTGDPNATFNDATIVARACIVLDPMAPVRFRGHSVTADGLGPALAAAMRKPGNGPIFADLIRSRVLGTWAHFHKLAGGKKLPANGILDRIGRWVDDPSPGNGIERCLYELNPNQPCFSDVASGMWVSEPAHVLEALEASAGPDRKPVDRHLAAFLSSHAGANTAQIKALMNPEQVDAHGGIAIVKLMADLQEKFGPPSVPRLTAWCAGLVRQFVDTLHNLPLRTLQLEQLNKVSEEGNLGKLLELVDNEKMRDQDVHAFQNAKESYASAELEIGELHNGGKIRMTLAIHAGKEAAALTAASLSGVVGIGSLLLRVF